MDKKTVPFRGRLKFPTKVNGNWYGVGDTVDEMISEAEYQKFKHTLEEIVVVKAPKNNNTGVQKPPLGVKNGNTKKTN